MKLVFISDTHNRKISVPDGDVLIHCGDATSMGKVDEIIKFNAWMGTFPHATKLFIPGNHDWLLERDPALARELLFNMTVLIDEAIEIGGVKFYGSPWQPFFFAWAFNLSRFGELKEKWALIPNDTEVLITHGPPAGILDTVINYRSSNNGESVGCHDLLQRVRDINPLLLRNKGKPWNYLHQCLHLR
jgi:Icc-related predicted phosphoesterase